MALGGSRIDDRALDGTSGSPKGSVASESRVGALAYVSPFWEIRGVPNRRVEAAFPCASIGEIITVRHPGGSRYVLGSPTAARRLDVSDLLRF